MFLTIKKIPKVYWSSKKPLNFKPKISSFIFLCFGLALFGLGEGLLIVSYSGASPWSVLAQGMSLHIDLSIGVNNFFYKFICSNFCGFFRSETWNWHNNEYYYNCDNDRCFNKSSYQHQKIIYSQLILAVMAVLIVGFGGGIYLVANLGAGPRDGLMVGLQKKTNMPIAAVRAFLEITVVTIGWYLGGTVGVGYFIVCFWNRSSSCFRTFFNRKII